MSVRSPEDPTPIVVDGKTISPEEEQQILSGIDTPQTLNKRRYSSNRAPRFMSRASRSPRSPADGIKLASPASPIRSNRSTASGQSSQSPRPVQPAQSPRPVQPAQSPRPVQPAQSPRPVQPAQSPRPVQPAQSPGPVQPAQSPRPVQPAQSPHPAPTRSPARSKAAQRKQSLLESLKESEVISAPASSIPPHQSPSQTRSQPVQAQYSQGRSQPIQDHYSQSRSHPVQDHYSQSRSQPVQDHYSQSRSHPPQDHYSQSRSHPPQDQYSQSRSHPPQDQYSQSRSQPAQYSQSPSYRIPVHSGRTHYEPLYSEPTITPVSSYRVPSSRFEQKAQQLELQEAELRRRREELEAEKQLKEREQRLAAERAELDRQQEQVYEHSSLQPPPLGATQGVIVTNLRKRRAGLDQADGIDFERMSQAELRKFNWELDQKYSDLMRLFPNYRIPKGMLQEPLEIKYSYYLTYQKRTLVDFKVQQMKWYIIGAIILAEIITTKFLKLPTKNFAMNEMSSMAQYEMALREMVERNFNVKAEKISNPIWSITKTMTINLVLYTVVMYFLGSAGETMGPKIISEIKTHLGGTTLKAPNQAGTDGIPNPVAPNQGGGFQQILGLLSGLGNINLGNPQPAPTNPVDDSDLPDYTS